MDITIPYPAVRDTYKRLAKGDTSGITSQPALGTLSSIWKADRQSSFFGAKTAQVIGWVDNGYTPKDFTQPIRPPAAPKRRRMRYSEDEGELHIELALSGSDRPFVEPYVTRPKRAGFRVQIGMQISASVDAKHIAQYGEWIAGMLQRFETEGLDVSVDITSTVREWTVNGTTRDTICVRVKEIGERNDFRSWSALFSPAGFRTLVFTAYGLAADKIGKKADIGFGYPDAGKAWDVRYDPSERVLYVQCPGQFSEFPAELMTTKLDRALDGK